MLLILSVRQHPCGFEGTNLTTASGGINRTFVIPLDQRACNNRGVAFGWRCSGSALAQVSADNGDTSAGTKGFTGYPDNGAELVPFIFIGIDHPQDASDQHFITRLRDDFLGALPVFDVLVKNGIQHRVIGETVAVFLIRP
jgi:hypothetical protein